MADDELTEIGRTCKARGYIEAKARYPGQLEDRQLLLPSLDLRLIPELHYFLSREERKKGRALLKQAYVKYAKNMADAAITKGVKSGLATMLAVKKEKAGSSLTPTKTTVSEGEYQSPHGNQEHEQQLQSARKKKKKFGNKG
jgi:hypothetical protein